jgi:hypothetical protein
MSKVKNDDEEEEEDFDTFLIHHNDKHRRALASKIASSDRQNGWTDEDIELLLNELEIEVGEGTNRFVYEDERPLYCLYLSQNIEFEQPKSPEQIFDKILWLWSAWESISRATGKSWWNTTEQEKYEQSLLSENKGKKKKKRGHFYQ